MNKIKVNVDFTNGKLTPNGIPLITGDYASTEIEFAFDREDGTKVFEMKSPSGQVVFASEIIDNKILLAAKDQEEHNVSLFNESGFYIFEISLYVDSENSKLTSVFGRIPVEKEQVVIDGEVVEAYLPVFDQLLSQVSTAITQTNNLNLSSSKSGKITTITITKKDGTTETRQVLDGADFEYNWSGTSLGVKTSDEGTYTYVDLKGEKGEPGAIKMLIVAELPATGADDTIYLVPITPDTSGNNYAEYVYINGAWELLGKIGVQVDLTDYVKNTDYATTSNAGVVKVPNWGGLSISAVGNLSGLERTYAQYQSAENVLVVAKGTLENVITGKGLTTKSYVDGLVGDINSALDLLNGEVI